MFQLAIVIRLLAFAVFVACVYGGNLLFLRLEHRKLAVYWKIVFVTLYSIFLLLVTYVVWLVFYFGLNASVIVLSVWQDNFVSGQRRFPCVSFCSIIVSRQKDRNVL